MAKGAIIRGTSREQADHGTGYAGNGLGEWTRHAAQPGKGINLTAGDRPRDDTRLLRETEKEMAKLQRSMARETNSVRMAKLHKNFEIKSRFIARLRNE